MSVGTYLVLGSKGGAGATTLAVDLARTAARVAAVTIVDADLSGRRAMSTLLEADRALDAERSRGVFSTAQIGTMEAIELLDRHDNIYALKKSEIEALAARIPHDRFVFVDAPRPFEDLVRPFVSRASRVLLVFEPSVLGATSARRLIADLARFGIPPARVSLVVNARGGRPDVSPRELERTLGTQVLAELPRTGDRAYAKALDTVLKRLADAPPEDPFVGLQTAAPRPAPSTISGDGSAAQPEEQDRVVEDAEKRVRADARMKLKLEVSSEVTRRVDVVAASRAHTDGQKFSELREQIGGVIDQILSGRSDVGVQERAELQQEIIDEQLGLGPLEDLMRDERVSEIMVNGPKMIYVERGGKIVLSERTFKDERHLRTVIERIVAPLGRRIDESSPMVDARLVDGSRVNAIIEPLALDGSSITIRRFSKKRLGIEDLVKFGSIAPESVGLLRAVVEARLNVVVSGGTGSGKTTFLNILSNFIPEDDRILTIEDAAELSLAQAHVVRLESRPPNIEGKGAVTIRDLVKNSLRMRPDRIVVGECRSGEALDMLQAMNTGHDGSLTTLHANTPRDAMARLETLVLMAGFDLPIRAIREQIASAVDVVVQIERMRDGSRKCSSITEVVGMEGDVVTMQEIVRYQQEGLDEDGKVRGRFEYTGVQPHHATRFEEAGVRFDVRELMALQPVRAAW